MNELIHTCSSVSQPKIFIHCVGEWTTIDLERSKGLPKNIYRGKNGALYSFDDEDVTCIGCKMVRCPGCGQFTYPHTHPTANGVKTKHETDFKLVAIVSVADLLEAINKAPKEFLKYKVNVYEVDGRKFPMFEIVSPV